MMLREDGYEAVSYEPIGLANRLFRITSGYGLGGGYQDVRISY